MAPIIGDKVPVIIINMQVLLLWSFESKVRKSILSKQVIEMYRLLVSWMVLKLLCVYVCVCVRAHKYSALHSLHFSPSPTGMNLQDVLPVKFFNCCL